MTTGGPHLITDGLVLYYDAVNNKSYTEDLSLIDVSTWTIGTGSTTGTGLLYTQNGTTAENERKLATDPWGNNSIVWESVPVVNASSDGGFNLQNVTIDNTKTYRFSVWLNRKVKGTDGTFYFGIYGNGTVDGLKYLHNTSITTNPYFFSNYADLLEDQWVLCIGHIYPHDTATGGSAYLDASGIYNTSATKVDNITNDFRWLPETTTSRPRAYLFYSTTTTPVQQWSTPRFDLIDGTEPSIQDLVNNTPNKLKDLTRNKNTSTLINGPVYSDGGILFDGVKDYVDLGSNKTFAEDTYTLEFVFNAKKMPTTTGSSDIQNIIGASTSSNNINYLAIRAQKIALWNINTTGSGAAVNWYSSTTTLVVDTTYHVSITCDNGNYKIYLNGVLDSSIPFLGTSNNFLNIRYIGTNISFVRNFDGTIYNLKAYNKTLTSTEVTQNFEAVRSKYGL